MKSLENRLSHHCLVFLQIRFILKEKISIKALLHKKLKVDLGENVCKGVADIQTLCCIIKKTTMNRLLSFFLTLLIPFLAAAQELEFKSKEYDKYYNELKFKPFKPLDSNEILSYSTKAFDLQQVVDFIPYSDSSELTPYQDSIFPLMLNYTNFPKPQFIGEIDKSHIILFEKKGPMEAMLYKNSKFEDISTGEEGIWVAFSENSGSSWKYLYTGIVQRQPLYLKWYSKVPFIKSDGKLQVEATLFRQLTPFILPVSAPTYEIVKDGLLLTLDLNALRKDTDSDCLTDIVEAKLHTNPANKDTDGDGQPDNLDLNPRFSVARTDKTILFETIVNDKIAMFDTTEMYLSSDTLPPINYATDTTETILIVTDSPDIQSIQPSSKRVIILTEEEYNKQKGLFQNELNTMSISPLFKVDNETDTYFFDKSFESGGGTYLVKYTKNGWKISIISSWIT
jgi:hypothetical protein